MIEFKSVNKNFGDLRALVDITLTAQSGKTTVLLGQSGCGKSTLMRMIAGLIKPDGGKVLVNGQMVDHSSLQSIRKKIGYVIQEGGLFPHLTAKENISLAASHFGIPVETIEQILFELISLSKFPKDGLNKYPAQLSGGQKQRVSLMRALMLDPEILLLDEPLGALDPLIRFDLQNDLKDIFTELKKTVVLVTHDLSEAAFFADWVVLMKDGEIVQQGKINDLIENPIDSFVTKFIKAQRSAVIGK